MTIEVCDFTYCKSTDDDSALIQSVHLDPLGPGLLPYELVRVAKDRLKQPDFQHMCTPAFLDSVFCFVRDVIATKASVVRREYGMIAALEEPLGTAASSGSASLDCDISGEDAFKRPILACFVLTAHGMFRASATHCP